MVGVSRPHMGPLLGVYVLVRCARHVGPCALPGGERSSHTRFPFPATSQLGQPQKGAQGTGRRTGIATVSFSAVCFSAPRCHHFPRYAAHMREKPTPWLLALDDELQRRLFELVSDALRPIVVLNLSACCHDFHTVTEAARADLRQRHNEARWLCARVNTNCAAVSESKEVLWYGQGLTVAHMGTLGTLLRTNALPLLEVLNLSINRFGAAGLQALFGQLGCGSMPRLRILDLTGNALGSPGAAVLAAALRCGTLPKLEVLKLGRNDIGDEGLVELSAPLRRLPALTALYLYNNKIGDEGVAALLANLGPDHFKQLQTLKLERNLISVAHQIADCATLIAALGRAPASVDHEKVREALQSTRVW
jgi:hypothetical protein